MQSQLPFLPPEPGFKKTRQANYTPLARCVDCVALSLAVKILIADNYCLHDHSRLLSRSFQKRSRCSGAPRGLNSLNFKPVLETSPLNPVAAESPSSLPSFSPFKAFVSERCLTVKWGEFWQSSREGGKEGDSTCERVSRSLLLLFSSFILGQENRCVRGKEGERRLNGRNNDT